VSDSGVSTTLEAAFIAALRPATALALGPRAAGPFAGFEGRLILRADPPWLTDADAAARFDLVWVDGVLEQESKDAGLRLLCRLRDFHTARLYVRALLGDWQENDFFALGMERLATTPTQAGTLVLFGFDLLTYKKAPEWFNAKYWAHPELWDKYPWFDPSSVADKGPGRGEK
jgi:hypothetical protein